MLKIEHINIVSPTIFQDFIGEIVIDFEGETIKDFLMVQEIMRSLIIANFCRESNFGYDENLKLKRMFSYPKNREISLVAKLDEKNTYFEFFYKTPNKTEQQSN